jgi:hypothetical protein
VVAVSFCRTCHGSNLNNPAVAAVPSCDSCHTGGTAWRTDCTFCHGDKARVADGLDAGGAPLAAAPPFDAAGLATSVQVGAHRAHLYATDGISSPMKCTSCHTVPADIAHVNGAIAVALKDPLGAASGTFTPSSGATAASCTTYCHDPSASGAITFSWGGALPAGQSACTACHGFSPTTGLHPAAPGSPHTGTGLFGANRSNCYPCHRGVVTNAAPSALDPTGISSHVDGSRHVSGPLIFGWDSANKRCYGVACHGDSNTQFKTW